VMCAAAVRATARDSGNAVMTRPGILHDHRTPCARAPRYSRARLATCFAAGRRFCRPQHACGDGHPAGCSGARRGARQHPGACSIGNPITTASSASSPTAKPTIWRSGSGRPSSSSAQRRKADPLVATTQYALHCNSGVLCGGVPVGRSRRLFEAFDGFRQTALRVDALTPAAVIFDDGVAHALCNCLGLLFVLGDIKLMAMQRAPAERSHGTSVGPLSGAKPDRHAADRWRRSCSHLVRRNAKGVINTQRMMMSNQQALAQVWPGLSTIRAVVDWLP